MATPSRPSARNLHGTGAGADHRTRVQFARLDRETQIEARAAKNDALQAAYVARLAVQLAGACLESLNDLEALAAFTNHRSSRRLALSAGLDYCDTTELNHTTASLRTARVTLTDSTAAALATLPARFANDYTG